MDVVECAQKQGKLWMVGQSLHNVTFIEGSAGSCPISPRVGLLSSSANRHVRLVHDIVTKAMSKKTAEEYQLSSELQFCGQILLSKCIVDVFHGCNMPFFKLCLCLVE